jgi:adenylate cyclase
MDAELVNMADHIMPSISYVDLAWARGDVRLAEHHSERAFSMASQSGSPYFRTYATASRGLSHIVAGRFGSAVEDLTTALDLCRQRQAGLEYESRILAHLSEAYRRQGNLNSALDAAKDAIVIGSQRGARTGECLAHIMLGHALIELKDRLRATDEADRAEVLIEETGARLFARVQTELKSKLALQLSAS